MHTFPSSPASLDIPSDPNPSLTLPSDSPQQSLLDSEQVLCFPLHSNHNAPSLTIFSRLLQLIPLGTPPSQSLHKVLTQAPPLQSTPP